MDTGTRLGFVLFCVSFGATCVVPLIQNSRWGRRVLVTVATLSFAAAAYLLVGPRVVEGIKRADWSGSASLPRWEVMVAVAVSLSLLAIAIWPARLLIRRIRTLLGRGADAFYRRVAASLAEEMGHRKAMEMVRQEAEQRRGEPKHGIKSRPAGGSRRLQGLAEESGGSVLPLVRELEKHDLRRLGEELEKYSASYWGRKFLDGDLD